MIRKVRKTIGVDQERFPGTSTVMMVVTYDVLDEFAGDRVSTAVFLTREESGKEPRIKVELITEDGDREEIEIASEEELFGESAMGIAPAFDAVRESEKYPGYIDMANKIVGIVAKEVFGKDANELDDDTMKRLGCCNDDSDVFAWRLVAAFEVDGDNVYVANS